MPFSIHMDEETRLAIEALARKSGKSRNALIGDAVREFVRSRAAQEWPENVRAWICAGRRRAGASLPAFESYRGELAEQGEPDL